MGTRGFVGFVADGKEKIAYCHSDAYPGGLGADVLKWLHGVEDLDVLAAAIEALRVVGRDEVPTDEDIERLKPWTNLSVASRSTSDWYCLLRETQGEPAQMLRAGYIEDASEFPTDSLFAEWGFIADLDAGVFEAYRGFQEEPHDKGRFADREPLDRGYWPVALAASWSLKELPTLAEFLSVLDPDGDE